jgi:hypothetical protein
VSGGVVRWPYVARGTLATFNVLRGTLAARSGGAVRWPYVARGTLATFNVPKGTLAAMADGQAGETDSMRPERPRARVDSLVAIRVSS